jgi:hypothetical protein
MDILITIPDAQWQEFQEVAKEAVDTQWHGIYEDFATYIMKANISRYIESQKKKQKKKMKHALADYEESLRQEEKS